MLQAGQRATSLVCLPQQHITKIIMDYLDKKAMYCQLDPRWGRLRLGNTPYTVRSWGCTLFCIIKLIFEMTGKNLEPDEAIKKPDFDSIGQFYWGSVKKMSKWIKFISRVGKGAVIKPSHSLATSYARPEKKFGMLIELNWRPAHWVLLMGWGNRAWPFFMAFDPLKGRIRRFPKWQIKGYALFRKLEDWELEK